jgi:hypothetical protein
VPVDLPAPIPGDPAGMRALALGLRADAAAIAVVATDVDGRVASTEFIGPAADRMRERTDGFARRSTRMAERLVDSANYLERAASELEAAQRERLRLIEQLLRDSAAAAGGSR